MTDQTLPGSAPGLPVPCPDWYHRDNRFPSRRRMDWAHRPIVALAARTLAGRSGNVLDLGCGNGALLRKIHALAPHVTPFGVERVAERVAHARTLLPAFAANLVEGDLGEDPAGWGGDRRFALAILTPRRLQEIGPTAATRLREWIFATCDRLLVYGYGKTISEFGNLAGFAREVGIAIEDAAPAARAALARRR